MSGKSNSNSNGMRYLALGKKVKMDRETRAELIPPWTVYAVLKTVMYNDRQGQFYKLIDVDAGEPVLQELEPEPFSCNRDLGRVMKYVHDRAIFNCTDPGCVVDKATAILLFSLTQD